MISTVVSVIIPTYNRKNQLEKCLDSVFRIDYPIDKYEIIVVDDGSTDRTEEMMRELIKKSPCELKYFKQRNQGPAAARNLGIKNAKGNIIAFTDDDCLVPKNWIEELIKGYDKHPEVVGVGGYLKARDDVILNNIFAQYEQYKGRNIYKTGPVEVISGFDCPAGGTNNMSYKKQILKEIGGFDETFKCAAGEDADLKFRICKKGYQLLYIPIKVTHIQDYTLKRFCRQYYIRGIGEQYFQEKHGKKRSKLLIVGHLLLFPLLFLLRIVTSKNKKIGLVEMFSKLFIDIGKLHYGESR